MTPDPRLLLQATPELLEGWCGPVVVRDRTTEHHTVWQNGGWLDTFTHRWRTLGAGDVYLDLSRAECRDRVARMLATLTMDERDQRYVRECGPMTTLTFTDFDARGRAHVVTRRVYTPRMLDAYTPTQRTRALERLLDDPDRAIRERVMAALEASRG